MTGHLNVAELGPINSMDYIIIMKSIIHVLHVVIESRYLINIKGLGKKKTDPIIPTFLYTPKNIF